MIDAESIAEILSVYKKHGWNLRRVLLSAKLAKSFPGKIKEVIGDAEIIASDLDAMWFSRSSKPGFETWEIRHLSETPFALVEVIEDSLSETEAREIRRNAELRMIEITQTKRQKAASLQKPAR